MKIKSKKTTVETVVAKKTVRRTAKASDAGEKKVAFTVRAEPGKTVYVAGTFNQWNATGKKMADKKGDGVYAATLKLAPGRYEYKYVIDGIWCADPECADWVQNDQGTTNSVIVVE